MRVMESAPLHRCFTLRVEHAQPQVTNPRGKITLDISEKRTVSVPKQYSSHLTLFQAHAKRLLPTNKRVFECPWHRTCFHCKGWNEKKKNTILYKQ